MNNKTVTLLLALVIVISLVAVLGTFTEEPEPVLASNQGIAKLEVVPAEQPATSTGYAVLRVTR